MQHNRENWIGNFYFIVLFAFKIQTYLSCCSSISSFVQCPSFLSNLHCFSTSVVYDSLFEILNYPPPRGNRLMFWTDWGVQPKIERSNLVGTDRSVLLTTGLLRPQGLTIDYDENRLYWVDDETDTVEMADLDGGHRSSFSAKEPGHFDHQLFGIAVYKV